MPPTTTTNFYPPPPQTIKELEGNKKDLTSEMAALRKGLKEVKQVQLHLYVEQRSI